MQFPEPPMVGRFCRRYKRFFADIEVDGEIITAHCPNTGSLMGCLEEGAPAWLRDSHNPKRKLRYTWQAIQIDGTWVNVDTGLPNALAAEGTLEGTIPELGGYEQLKREVRYGENSRADLHLSSADGRQCWVEVKNTTLVDGPQALFPDAVTERGRKHLRELSAALDPKIRAVQFFLISRSDVTTFRPADHIDPAYGAALRAAAQAGVELLAYTADVRAESITIGHRLPIELPAMPPEAVARLQRRKRA